ncbi:hypothetical protein BJX64DRAFT_190530 [Aspergillus heterothallicus]
MTGVFKSEPVEYKLILLFTRPALLAVNSCLISHILRSACPDRRVRLRQTIESHADRL